MQFCPTAQLFPHAPQLFVFVFRLTHSPPQSVKPEPQVFGCEFVHTPDTHVCPFWHITPQEPQLEGSILVSTHSLPHNVFPDGQRPGELSVEAHPEKNKINKKEIE